jgi:branched-chain amino acid transport system ATP-binding protein
VVHLGLRPGSALAGGAGTLLSLRLSFLPALGVEFQIYAFAVVIIGGLGSFKGFSAFENVRLGLLAHWGKCRDLRRPVDEIPEVVEPALGILEAVGLVEERDTLAAAMSHGDQKRLEIALSLTSDPKLLLLNEPTAGMNPDETKRIAQLIGRIARERATTVIFCEPGMSLVFGLARRIVGAV